MAGGCGAFGSEGAVFVMVEVDVTGWGVRSEELAAARAGAG